MATESTHDKGPGGSAGSAREPENGGTAIKDILVDSAANSALLPGGVGSDESGAGTASPIETVASPGMTPEPLDIGDVLSSVAGGGTDPDATGAYVTFEALGGDTLVTVGLKGATDTPALTVLTLEGVTGFTLQQLLQNDNGVS